MTPASHRDQGPRVVAPEVTAVLTVTKVYGDGPARPAAEPIVASLMVSQECARIF